MNRIIKILPPPAKYAFLFWLLLYRIFRPFFVLLLSLFRIPVAFKKKVQRDKKDFTLKMMFTENSNALIRNLLIALNSISDRILSSGYKTGKLTVYMRKDVRFDNLDEIFSCFHLIPLSVDIAINLGEDIYNDQFSFLKSQDANKISEVNSLKVFINDSYMSVNSFDYFKHCSSNFLDVPVSTKVWARNILKGYPPQAFIISIHFPENNGKINADVLMNWQTFFLKAWKDFPRIHFLLLNFSIDWDKEIISRLPNVTVTKTVGYNFLEEFALVKLSDMYIGAYDKYAAAVIGTDEPFMLFGGGTELSNIKQLSRNKHQIWISKIPSPEEIYLMFKEFYADIYGK